MPQSVTNDDDGLPFQFNWPCAVQIIGTSNSGKTSLLTKFLTTPKIWGGGGKPSTATSLTYVYGCPTKNVEILRSHFPKMNFICVDKMENLPSLCSLYSTDEPKGRHILILDDISLYTSQSEDYTRFLDVIVHHANVIVFSLEHCAFGRGNQRIIQSNKYNIIILFALQRNAYQVTEMAKQIQYGLAPFLNEAYEQATAKPHHYLVINFTEPVGSPLRFLTDVLEEDRPTQVFLPNKK